MKNKKFLCLLTALAMTASVSPCVYAAEADNSYPDVKEGDWFYSYVKDVAGSELMTGYDDGSFGAYDNLARGQFATILYRMEGKPDVTDKGSFPDVTSGQFYTSPAEWAGENQIITGYSDGRFGPGDDITREQLVTIMYRYAKMKGQDISAKADYTTFPDGASVSEFASEAMQWAIANEIIKGNGDGTLAPQGKVSRAVCATMISRYAHGEIKDEQSDVIEGNELKHTYATRYGEVNALTCPKFQFQYPDNWKITKEEVGNGRDVVGEVVELTNERGVVVRYVYSTREFGGASASRILAKADVTKVADSGFVPYKPSGTNTDFSHLGKFVVGKVKIVGELSMDTEAEFTPVDGDEFFAVMPESSLGEREFQKAVWDFDAFSFKYPTPHAFIAKSPNQRFTEQEIQEVTAILSSFISAQ